MAVIELVQQKLVATEAEAARKTKFAKDEKAEKPAVVEADEAEVVDQDADAPESATKDAAEAPAEGADEAPKAEDKKDES
jgi:large subunit ribosomal protein L17